MRVIGIQVNSTGKVEEHEWYLKTKGLLSKENTPAFLSN